MADQDLLAGSQFQLERKGAGDATFKFVCLATTITFTRSSEVADATAVDCDDPLALPNERNVKTRLSWAINFSGRTDPARLELIEQDYEADEPSEYRIVVDRSAARGGKNYTGFMHITQLELGRADRGMVTFSAQGRGDGALTRTAAAS